MTTPEGFGGNPFEGGPFGDMMKNLARFFTGQGPVNWEIARQMAQWAAAGGSPESNPDPVSRVRLKNSCGSPRCTYRRLPASTSDAPGS